MLPDFNFVCKFVLIENNDDRWLVFGPQVTYRYHAQLVDKYCTLKVVPCAWINKPELTQILDANHKILGGGTFEFDKENMRLRIYGHSKAYGRFDASEAKKFMANHAQFRELKVIIGT